MWRLLLLIATTLACLTACETEAPPDPPEVDMYTCTNPVAGYTVNYPADWETNANGIMSRCSLFDPERIQIEPATEIPADIAVAIRVEPAEFERITQDFFEQRVISREADEVDGRQALQLELENTEQLLHPIGTRSYAYYVDLGDETLIAITYDIGEPPYEETRDVLDLMMTTLQFTGN